MIFPWSNKRSVTGSTPGIDGMRKPALLNRWAVFSQWPVCLSFAGFRDVICCCLRVGVTGSSRNTGVASGLACLGVVLSLKIGFFMTNVSLWLDVRSVDSGTMVGFCVRIFDVGGTVDACFSAAMVAHLATLLIAMTAFGSSTSPEATPKSLRLCMRGVTVASRVLCTHVPVRSLLSLSSSDFLRELGLPLSLISGGK